MTKLQKIILTKLVEITKRLMIVHNRRFPHDIEFNVREYQGPAVVCVMIVHDKSTGCSGTSQVNIDFNSDDNVEIYVCTSGPEIYNPCDPNFFDDIKGCIDSSIGLCIDIALDRLKTQVESRIKYLQQSARAWIDHEWDDEKSLYYQECGKCKEDRVSKWR